MWSRWEVEWYVVVNHFESLAHADAVVRVKDDSGG
jgi:hypothetical protein